MFCWKSEIGSKSFLKQWESDARVYVLFARGNHIKSQAAHCFLLLLNRTRNNLNHTCNNLKRTQNNLKRTRNRETTKTAQSLVFASKALLALADNCHGSRAVLMENSTTMQKNAQIVQIELQ